MAFLNKIMQNKLNANIVEEGMQSEREGIAFLERMNTEIDKI